MSPFRRAGPTPLAAAAAFFAFGAVLAAPPLRRFGVAAGAWVVGVSCLAWSWAAAAEERRHQAETANALGRERDHFVAALASIGDGVIVTDVNGLVTFMNAEAERLTGWSAQDAAGRALASIFITVDASTHRPAANPLERAKRAGASGPPASPSLLLSKYGQETLISDSVALTNRQTGPKPGDSGIVIAFRDVTEQHRQKEAQARLAATVEAELRARVEARTAELSEKSRLLESFVYTVAHDLRAPLRAIYGYAEFLSEDLGPGAAPKVIEQLDRIKAATERMDRLIQDLLAFSRVTEMELAIEPVPLQHAVEHALRELEPAIQRVHAHVDVRGPLPAVKADPNILDQVVINLVSNAVKFAKPGVPPKVEVSSSRHDGAIRLAVRDNGIGIPRAYQDRVFKIFERLHAASYPGTGVGLAIVARAAERLGGRVGLESAPDQGSTFWVELPAG